MFEFIKKVFFTGFEILSGVNPLSALISTSLKCVSMNNQECKVRPEIVNVNSDEPVFCPFSIKQVIAVVVLTISVINMQKCVVLMLLKTQMLKYLI